MIGMKNREIAAELITDLDAVDTGALRGSMSYRVDLPDRRVIAGSDIEYAIHVHEGTSKMPGRPFLRDSILNHRGDYLEIIAKTLGEGFTAK
jgi:hypothetical protein